MSTERELLQTIIAHPDDWLAHHAAILASTPLRKVRMTTIPEIGENRDEFFLIGGPTNAFGRLLVPRGERRKFSDRDITMALLNQLWGPRDGRPGIEFELPES